MSEHVYPAYKVRMSFTRVRLCEWKTLDEKKSIESTSSYMVSIIRNKTLESFGNIMYMLLI